MRFKLLGTVTLMSLGLGLSTGAYGQGNKKNKGQVGDQTIDKQMAWENKVMGEDQTKSAEMRKIAAAQKLAEEARKNPPPEPAPKVKDPNKEGVRAKQEAAIGLAIPSDEPEHKAKKAPVAKKAETKSSTDDELGQLVAASLAEEKPEPAAHKGATAASPKARKAKGRKGKGGGTAAAPSALDQMFAAGK